jgi:hypothetical protein
MANQSEERGTGQDAGSESKNPRTQPKQPIGGGQISREEEKSGRAGGQGQTSQQSNADADGASRQTSTAQDEKGQL